MAAAAHGGLLVAEQARQLGVSMSTLWHARREARDAGFDVPKAPIDRSNPRGWAANRRAWAALEAAMVTACERCGLRGPHECLPDRADPHARRPLEMPSW